MLDLKALLDQNHCPSLALTEKHINPAMAKVLRIIGYDIRFVRGQGPYLYDDKGTQYLDCLGGYAVFNLGRNHPVVRDALKQAMDLDLPNLIKMGTPTLSGVLARELIAIAPSPTLDTVFFTNSGAEGIETAIKYARAATGRTRILHAKKSFHGLTCGALAINGNDEFKEGFGPMLGDCDAVPYGDVAALERELAKKDVAAFIVEPIQGKGVNIPPEDYLPSVARLCKQLGSLYVADEVQTGFGRTGKMWACQNWVSPADDPDILVCAKALSGGYVPVGAVLSKRWVHDKVFSSLDRCVVHSTTFGQNELAMAAGLATLHVLREERIVERAASMGRLLVEKLSQMVGKYELVKEVRGKGLMVAVEFHEPRGLMLKTQWKIIHKLDPSLFPQAILMPLLTDHHILAQTAGHHLDVIKLIPPLVLSEADVDHIADAFDKVVASCSRVSGPMWEVGKRLGGQALKRQFATAEQT
ncbi:MAG: aminotransferase class III-fold pyridoxal phosphate-dependent enzyme [Phycisphaera sp.]|nr:aminotransferase class III-fold pyridoxal phosphate-dependent enzyme [Phycisphaera sp.]